MCAEVKKALEQITSLGFMLDEDAFELVKMIEEDQNFSAIIDDVVREASQATPRPLILSRDAFQRVIDRLTPKTEVAPHEGVKTYRPLAAEYGSRMEVVFDPSKMIGSAGTLDDFHKYFCDRFERMSRILKERLDARDAVTLRRALKTPPNSKVKFIAMVTEKRDRKGRAFLRVEDLEEAATVLVPEALASQYTALNLTLDQVVCFDTVKGQRDFFIAKSIIFPDIPERKLEATDDPLSALLLADVHFGSKTFLDEVFSRMIFWLNGKLGSEKQVEAAGAVKYLTIAGDLVDGVGVYPDQERDLLIPDIYRQYQLVAQYIEQIPEHIEVIVIPGNHDAVSQALPQPAIPSQYAEPVYEVRRITSLGNPCEVKLNDRAFLIYHGNNLVDVISSIPNASLEQPHKGVEHLLKIRHLAPEFGAKTPISPELADLLVIQRPPDVMQTGHLHREGYVNYRGSQIVCCGAWQAQTEYQRRQGVNPTTGSASIIHLGEVRPSVLNFAEAM